MIFGYQGQMDFWDLHYAKGDIVVSPKRSKARRTRYTDTPELHAQNPACHNCVSSTPKRSGALKSRWS